MKAFQKQDRLEAALFIGCSPTVSGEPFISERLDEILHARQEYFMC